MILADVLRKSLSDPNFFYALRKTRETDVDAAVWRANILAAERYIFDTPASEEIGRFGVDDPAELEKALPLIRLPFPVIWIEFDLKAAMVASGSPPSKEGDRHCGILIRRASSHGHENAMRMWYVLDGDTEDKKMTRPPGRLPSRLMMSPATFTFDPLYPLLDPLGNMIAQDGTRFQPSSQQDMVQVFHDRRDGSVTRGVYNEFEQEDILFATRKNQSIMMGSALHRANTEGKRDHIERYYKIAQHGMLVHDDTCIRNMNHFLGSDIMFEIVRDTLRAMAGDFRRTLAILALLSIRYPATNRLTPILRREEVEATRDRQGNKLLKHVNVTLNIPRTVRVNYQPYFRNTAKVLGGEKRIIPRHDVEACWAHNYRAHGPNVCTPYDLHCWEANDLRLEKNADPVPDPHRFTCAHCGLKRWYRPERESGTPGAPRQTRDRYVTRRPKVAA